MQSQCEVYDGYAQHWTTKTVHITLPSRKLYQLHWAVAHAVRKRRKTWCVFTTACIQYVNFGVYSHQCFSLYMVQCNGWKHHPMYGWCCMPGLYSCRYIGLLHLRMTVSPTCTQFLEVDVIIAPLWLSSKSCRNLHTSVYYSESYDNFETGIPYTFACRYIIHHHHPRWPTPMWTWCRPPSRSPIRRNQNLTRRNPQNRQQLWRWKKDWKKDEK